MYKELHLSLKLYCILVLEYASPVTGSAFGGTVMNLDGKWLGDQSNMPTQVQVGGTVIYSNICFSI